MFGFPLLPCSMILLVRAVVLFQSAGGSNLDQQISQHAKLLFVSLNSMECLESDSGRLTGHPSSLFSWYKDMSWRGTSSDACCLTLYIYLPILALKLAPRHYLYNSDFYFILSDSFGSSSAVILTKC